MLANTVALGLLTLLRVAVAAPLEPRWSTDLLGESCKRKLTFGKDGHFKVSQSEGNGGLWRLMELNGFAGSQLFRFTLRRAGRRHLGGMG